MGYLHIDNLYRNQDILLFRECYAMEKVHGTSAHISFKKSRTPQLHFSSGGEKHDRFVSLFDPVKLSADLEALPFEEVVIFGEAYGGKQQGMKEVYGPELRFIVFDVKTDDQWLIVPTMTQVANSLGLEVVPWYRVSTDLQVLNDERDKPSEVAMRRGMGDNKPREGIVLRPPIEATLSDGRRIIAKHKQDSFAERATPQKVVDPSTLKVLEAAEAIAAEWVTPMRLAHVLDKLPTATDITSTKQVIAAMVEDVYREAKGEIVESKEASAAIGKKTATLFKQHLHTKALGSP